MNNQRFDRLAQSLGKATSRRQMLKALIVGALGGGGVLLQRRQPATAASAACTSKTCQQAGVSCGPAGDGCGNIIQCGSCPTGQLCGGGGTSGACGAPACTSKTCGQLGYNCGQATDGCGGTINCGSCPAGQTCGGGGTANVCGAGVCTPKTCGQLGITCGPAGNSCGSIIQCGSCPSGKLCGGGGTPGACGAPACTGKTCGQLGYNCGQATDGCGGTISCGSCTAPQTCGDGGTVNTCGCTPLTSCPAGLECGTISTGCGGSISCGSCTAPQTCGGGGTANTCGCIPLTSCPAGLECGTISDGCGGTLNCGICAAPATCGGGNPGQTNVCGITPTGLLRVTTNPALPAMIVVDGVPRDYWGLVWMSIAAGSHTVHFQDVPGYATPADQTVTVNAGQTTTVQGNFIALGNLRVSTSPALAGAISVDGVPRNQWGTWADFPVGVHTVCFGAVAGYTPPGCQQVTLAAGSPMSITGTYTAQAGAPGATGVGYLRVTTLPAVPGFIVVDGVPRDYWGLVWMEIAPGSHMVHFKDVNGYSSPADQTVTVTAGQTTTVQGVFSPLGNLRVQTSPALPVTVMLDGAPRNAWGVWADYATGSHQVCFGSIAGYITPACQNVTLALQTPVAITGTYAPTP